MSEQRMHQQLRHYCFKPTYFRRLSYIFVEQHTTKRERYSEQPRLKNLITDISRDKKEDSITNFSFVKSWVPGIQSFFSSSSFI